MAGSTREVADYLYFDEICGISPPAAVHLDGTPLLGRRHPQDAAQEALAAFSGAFYWLGETRGPLDS